MTAKSRPAELAIEVEQGGLSQPNLGITNRFAGGKTTESKVVEAEGENTLVTPEAGKALTLYWIALVTPEANSAEVRAEVKVGTQTPYTWYLGRPGGFVHWEPILGVPNAKLTVKLSEAQKVAASFTYSEG
jgi:hypothetical protein